MPDRPDPLPRAAYAFAIDVPTAYTDQDPNGHINNTAYYRFTDTIIALFRMQHGAIEPGRTMVTVENGARYMRETHFPTRLDVRLRVDRLGTSSLAFRIGIFTEGDDQAAAEITSTQVCIDTTTRRPVPIDGPLRARLEATMRGPGTTLAAAG